jgi:hypothetical protein
MYLEDLPSIRLIRAGALTNVDGVRLVTDELSISNIVLNVFKSGTMVCGRLRLVDTSDDEEIFSETDVRCLLLSDNNKGGRRDC